MRILPLAHPGAILEVMWGTRPFRNLSLLLCAAATASVYSPRGARADDLKLKDGSKISGDIVGFEENCFRVKTSYGFALVQKDQVVSIGVSEPTPAPAEKKLDPAGEKAPAAEKPKIETAAVSSPQPQPAAALAKPAPPSAPPSAPTTAVASKSPSLSAPPPMPNLVASSKAVVAAGNAVPPPPVVPPASKASGAAPSASSAAANPAPAAVAAPTTAAVVAPPKPPAPEPIREQVSGNMYTNETYRFHMYKPPDWDVIASAPAVLPGAITAMGTADDTTYLLIGQEATSKPLSAEMDATEHRLRDVMENFRPLGEEQITVSGSAAVEHHFRGSVDHQDWAGVVVLVPRGGKVYTIFGMTRADNDLFQLQENVISRAIASLQFTE